MTGFSVNANGSWNEAQPNVKVNGDWKPALPYTKMGGSWVEVFEKDMVLEFSTTAGLADRTPELPLQGTVNATVDWGDGNVDTYTTAGVYSHTYSTHGVYTVRISGTVTQFGASSVATPELVRCLSFGEIGLTSLKRAFQNAQNLTSVPDRLPVTSNVTDLYFALNCGLGSTFNDPNIKYWDVSHVTDMSGMFYRCSTFNQDIGSWDTSSVTNMSYMFLQEYPGAFNQDISGWDVSNVTTMERMFENCSNFNQDIGGWDVSSVTDMYGMFNRNYSFNQDIGSWDVSSVTDMGGMFNDASSFNQDLSGWCVQNISSEPVNFDSGADAWNLPRPVWGTCP